MSKESEAFERIDNTLCLNNIKGKLEFGIDTEEHTDCDSVIGMSEDLEAIKQALLKEQELEKENAELRQKVPEPKHYLKWEDLEFSEEYDTSFKVKLGHSIYTITCSTQKFNNKTKYVAIEIGWKTYFIEELNKQFFNDLHLEAVEE